MISTYHRPYDVNGDTLIGSCSICGENAKMRKNGTTKSGKPRYRCAASEKGGIRKATASDGVIAWCNYCNKWKSVLAFGLDATRPTGLNKVCRLCRFEQKTLSGHGITTEDYLYRLEAQGGTCAIDGCLVTNESEMEAIGRKMSIDHDHGCCPGRWSCGKCIRGILCNAHNRAIGMCHDNADELRALIKYIER